MQGRFLSLVSGALAYLVLPVYAREVPCSFSTNKRLLRSSRVCGGGSIIKPLPRRSVGSSHVCRGGSGVDSNTPPRCSLLVHRGGLVYLNDKRSQADILPLYVGGRRLLGVQNC